MTTANNNNNYYSNSNSRSNSRGARPHSKQDQQTRRRVEARTQYSKRQFPTRNTTQHYNHEAAPEAVPKNSSYVYRSKYRNEASPRGAVVGLTNVNTNLAVNNSNRKSPSNKLIHVISEEVEFDTYNEEDDMLSVLSLDNLTTASMTMSMKGANPCCKAVRNKMKKKLRKAYARVDELEQEVKTLNNEVESKNYKASVKADKCAAQRDAAMEMVQKKDADLNRMMEMVKAMQSGASQKEKDALKAKKEAEEGCMMMKFECKSLKETIAKMEESQGADSARLQELQNEILQLSTKLQVEKELRAKSEQNEGLERAERISVSASMVAMAKEHAAKEAKFKGQFEEEIEDLKENIKEKEAQIGKINEECVSQHETITLLEEERNSLKNSLREKDTTEGSYIEENAQLRGEVALLRDQLQKANDNAKASQEKAEEHIKSLEEKIREGESLRRKLHNTVQELRGNIRVFARVRPFLPIDGVLEDAVPTISCRDESSLVIANEKDSHQFQYDRVFPATSTQEGVFNEVSEFVQSALDGYHVTLFSYGQTGSGKTHTMQGMRDDLRGIIPRAIEQVGKYKTDLELDGWVYEMHVSMLEIYNETIKDLLRETDEDKNSHDIKVDKEGERFVTNLSLKPIDPTNPTEIEKVMEQAARFRSVSATGMNQTSSRSHSVFTLHLKATHTEQKQKLKGTLNLVDLAGSERLQRSGVTGSAAKETAAINKSLSSLTDVFSALGKKSAHVPFRNSKLTYLLQPSFSGSGKTLMMVNLSPTDESFSESVSTLRFARQVNQCELGKAKKSVSLDCGSEYDTDAMSVSSVTSSSSRSVRSSSSRMPAPPRSSAPNRTRTAPARVPVNKSRIPVGKKNVSNRVSAVRARDQASSMNGSSRPLRSSASISKPGTDSTKVVGKHSASSTPSRSVRRKV